jgi:hypothetical protein
MILRLFSRLVRRLQADRDQRRVRARWAERFQRVYAVDADYAKPLAADLELEHTRYWERLGVPVLPDTLRVCGNIAGRAPVRLVPEEVFVSAVEPALNDMPEAGFLAHKSTYHRWFPDGHFPRTYLHRIAGGYCDPEFAALDMAEVSRIADGLDYPVVVKPTWGAFGGQDIHFVTDAGQLLTVMARLPDCVAQERLTQHPHFQAFNPHGLNTLRVCVYRSVRTGEVHVLNTTLRMGVGGSLDNETAGGIVCSIGDDGALNPFALDKHGRKFTAHPDTGIVFAEAPPLPDMAGLRACALDVAGKVLLARLSSLDMAMDADGRWRVLEVNLFGQTIRFSQYAGRPFFGDFTDEVVDWCLERRAAATR